MRVVHEKPTRSVSTSKKRRIRAVTSIYQFWVSSSGNEDTYLHR